MPPIWDQGQRGTCTSHAVLGALGYHLIKAGYSRSLSPWDIYNTARNGNLSQPDGASLRDVLQSLQKVGNCLSADWPYHPELNPSSPSGDFGHHRLENQIAAYFSSIVDPYEIKLNLSKYGPLPFVIQLTDGFYAPSPVGKVNYSGAKHEYHAICIVGWIDDCWIVRNSWGAEWGDQGYCYMPMSHPITECWGFIPKISTLPYTPRPWWWPFFLPWQS